ncbi:hypothetical protein AALP_AA2G039000 [Arabis alpina]|uniref:DUF4283 domain-containing protein n=1 Tax=Arabis alpina TaxID=50452 RepID=A0A087HF69_ARAAL|nr:hypothetical protein AALP_AA2G039000 [Arabis alpina]
MANSWFPKSDTGNLNQPPPLPPDPPDLVEFPLLTSPSPVLVFSSSPAPQTGPVSTASPLKLVVAPVLVGSHGPAFGSISMVENIPLINTTHIQSSVESLNPRSEVTPVVTVLEQSIPMETQAYSVDNEGILGAQPPVCLPHCVPQVDSTTSHDSQDPASHASTHSAADSDFVPQTWAEKLRRSSDRTLCRLAPAPTTLSPTGKPRIKISDVVFKQGAEEHKEYIRGSFLGKPPSYHLIQSVLNHMWGKGKKLEIHVDHGAHTMLIRLPNDVIRQKVLEKKFWHVDQCMFHVAPWGAFSGGSPLQTFPMWAHLKGVPFDLMTRVGLSLIGGLVGEPRERDEFTMKLFSLSVAHVKIEANLTKPLPDAVEVERDDGSIADIEVEYPWLPSRCSHCHHIGHIIRYCPTVTRAWVPKSAKENKSDGKDVNKGKACVEDNMDVTEMDRNVFPVQNPMAQP